MTETIIKCLSEEELPKIGKELLSKHHDKKVFAFIGEMGAGKTRFIKELCKLLKVKDSISSPTFSIINEYKTTAGSNIFHFDLYRLKSDEIMDLGCEEYFYSGDYCFIEWAEKAEQILPEDTVFVKITVEKSGTRLIIF